MLIKNFKLAKSDDLDNKDNLPYDIYAIIYDVDGEELRVNTYKDTIKESDGYLYCDIDIYKDINIKRIRPTVVTKIRLGERTVFLSKFKCINLHLVK